MTRKEVVFRMLGVGMLVGGLSVCGTAQQAKPVSQKQEGLNKALIHAVRRHEVKAVRTLLAQGADANAQDREAPADRSGALLLPSHRHPPAALVIVFDDAVLSTTGVHDGRKTKRRPDPTDMVKALLEQGADPNVVGYSGKSALLIAVENLYTTSVRLLLEHGAQVNRPWVHGITPLHVAAGNRDIPTVKLLVENGADRTAQSAFDNPVHPLDEEVRKLLTQTKEQNAGRR